MTIIDRSALLPYSAGQLYDLVNDVEAYPQFMDGCVGAEVLRRDDNEVQARLDLARGGIRQSFTTRNRVVPDEAIILELIDGPFEVFAGRWDFRALDQAACKMSLKLEFTFSSAVLGVAASKLFEKVSNNLVDAVGRRATQLYGEPYE